MRSRLAHFDQTYRHRMAWSMPASMMLVALVILVLSRQGILRVDPLAAQSGPLRILPQIDLDPLENSKDTAAPRLTQANDWVLRDSDLVDDPETPLVEITPTPALMGTEDKPQPTEDDVQTDLRTSGLPVLAQAQFEILHFERPVYPRTAREAGIEGLVEVILQVGTDGRVTLAQVATPGRLPLLEEAAITALRQALFRPYRRGGTPSGFWVRIPVRFSLVD